MDSLRAFVRGRWFPIIELSCAGLATVLWEIGSVTVYLPLLIALAPWVIRFAVGSNPFKGWGIDIALALFIITAASRPGWPMISRLQFISSGCWWPRSCCFMPSLTSHEVIYGSSPA